MSKSLALSVTRVSFSCPTEFETAYQEVFPREPRTVYTNATILPPPNHDEAPITERMSQPYCDAE